MNSFFKQHSPFLNKEKRALKFLCGSYRKWIFLNRSLINVMIGTFSLGFSNEILYYDFQLNKENETHKNVLIKNNGPSTNSTRAQIILYKKHINY